MIKIGLKTEEQISVFAGCEIQFFPRKKEIRVKNMRDSKTDICWNDYEFYKRCSFLKNEKVFTEFVHIFAHLHGLKATRIYPDNVFSKEIQIMKLKKQNFKYKELLAEGSSLVFNQKNSMLSVLNPKDAPKGTQIWDKLQNQKWRKVQFIHGERDFRVFSETLSELLNLKVKLVNTNTAFFTF